MRSISKTGLILLMLLALPALACSLSLDLPENLPIPDVEISQEDMQSAATMAAIAVATASDFAGTAVSEGGDFAGTAVAEGADLLATAEANAATAEANATIAAPPPGSDTSQTTVGNLTTIDNTFTLVVTDAEFNRFLAQQAETAAQELLRNPQVAFSDGRVSLTGEITQPITTNLVANFVPIVVNGQLQFSIINATVGGFPAPQSVLELIQSNVNISVTQAMAQMPPGTVIQNVGISGNTLTATGVTN